VNVFHHHKHEDETFLVLKGRFRMDFRDRHEWIKEGGFIVARRASSAVPWQNKNAGS
jgi:mannose-6-phosphate isomerase-like protein (cupin superfamily)